MKIQKILSGGDTGIRPGGASADRGEEVPRVEEVPRLDLSALTKDSHLGDPVPDTSPWSTESMDGEEARLSPQGLLVRQLWAEDADPLLSPRSYAFGPCWSYPEDTEVPPSPPNAHCFMRRQRSLSLGSCDDNREELTSAQLSKRIHALKRKINKYEEKFEEEHKYRPSHGNKAADPDVLRWMNELSKLQKDLKEQKLKLSEELLPPVTRQRSNTLPRSFGSQLERKPMDTGPRQPVDFTLEAVQRKLQERQEDAGHPDDIRAKTCEQIGLEKTALQRVLLCFESVHGRTVTKSEREPMKPLYDRYRQVKQIHCRTSTIPVIKEEDGSEGDEDPPTGFSVTTRPDFDTLGFQEEEAVFVSPSKDSVKLSDLHLTSRTELVKQFLQVREEKKRIRRTLRDFEDSFFRQNGRNVQKEERLTLAKEHIEYKHVKAKLKLLEVLISKRDSSEMC